MPNVINWDYYTDIKDYNLLIKLIINLNLNRRVNSVRQPLSLINYSFKSDDNKEDEWKMGIWINIRLYYPTTGKGDDKAL